MWLHFGYLNYEKWERSQFSRTESRNQVLLSYTYLSIQKWTIVNHI